MASSARRTLAHVILPDFSRYRDWTFSDPTKIHIDRATNTLRLRADAAGLYSTDADLWARGPLFSPSSARGWVGLTPTTQKPGKRLPAPPTGIQYRLYDGDEDRVWDSGGATWNAAETSDWNTLEEIWEGLPSFPLGPVAVVWNLSTADETVTPSVSRAVLMLTADVPDFTEDLVYRMLARGLKANVRPEADVAISWGGGTTLNFGGLNLEEPPGRVRSPVAAYSLTDDPDLETDLFSAYNSGTGILTLTGSVMAGKNVLLRVAYEPIVAFATHPDWNEVSALPAVILSEVQEIHVGRDRRREHVTNPTTFEATSVLCPVQSDFVVEMTLAAARSLDLWRLAGAVQAYVRSAPVLSSGATGAIVGLTVESEFSVTPRTDATHYHSGTMTIRLRGVEKWTAPPEALYGVGRVVVSGSVETTITD